MKSEPSGSTLQSAAMQSRDKDNGVIIFDDGFQHSTAINVQADLKSHRLSYARDNAQQGNACDTHQGQGTSL